MCVSPLLLWSGQEIPCRKCWQCIENKVNDWVGRCIAESETSVAAHSVTFTYGRDEDDRSDHLRAAVLTYSDVQKLFKRLRSDGYPCRYFAVGEMGSKKGRTHWHVLIFWQGRVPDVKLDTKYYTFKHWPQGFSYWAKVHPETIRYVCKYINKDMDDPERQAHLAMSKKPLLGAAYFDRRAAQFVKQGLAPQDKFYRFPEVKNQGGDIVQFYLRGAALDHFCQCWLDHWYAVNPGRHPPHSDLIEDYLDRITPVNMEWQPERFRARQSFPWVEPPAGSGRIQFSEPHNCFYVEAAGVRLWWSFDIEGNRAWQNAIRTEAGAPAIRSAAAAYRAASKGE